jgi:hypothetical protein
MRIELCAGAEKRLFSSIPKGNTHFKHVCQKADFKFMGKDLK